MRKKHNKIASYLDICCTVYHKGHNKQFKAFHFKFASFIVSNFHNLFNSITIAKLRMLNHQKKKTWNSSDFYLFRSIEETPGQYVRSVQSYNDKGTRTTSVVLASLLTLNRFLTVTCCFHCSLWTSKYQFWE